MYSVYTAAAAPPVCRSTAASAALAGWEFGTDGSDPGAKRLLSTPVCSCLKCKRAVPRPLTRSHALWWRAEVQALV